MNNLTPLRNETGIYATDLFNKRVEDIIDHHSPSKPMFLMISHIVPHTGIKVNGTGYVEVKNQTETDEEFSYIDSQLRRNYSGALNSFTVALCRFVVALLSRCRLQLRHFGK